MQCPNCEKETPDSPFCSHCGVSLTSAHENSDGSTDETSSSGSTTPSARGRVLAFDWKTASSVISGEDGNRYIFQGSDWNTETTPRTGFVVDFVTDGNEAKDVYQVYGQASEAGGFTNSPNESKRMIAGILAILLGSLGIHKFYLGYSQPGILLLVMGTLGWILVLPGIISVVIGFIEGLIYLTKSDEEFHEIYVVGRKSWF